MMHAVYKNSSKLPLLIGEEVKALEQKFAQVSNNNSYQLMQRAGEVLWQSYQQYFSQYKNILVVVGPGNNGGDGYEFALHALADPKIKISVRFVSENTEVKSWINKSRGDSKIALQQMLSQYNNLQCFTAADLINKELIIDGILGTGIKPSARKIFNEVIRCINQSQLPVLAIDTPSGLNADDGVEIGVAIKAHTTVSFIALKPGQVTAAGKSCCGELFLHNLGLSEQQQAMSQARYLTPLNSLLALREITHRQSNSHKGEFGRTVIIGGNRGLGGASILAAEAACRIGSGSVVLITHPENVTSALSRRPEVMVYGFATGDEKSKQQQHLRHLLEGASAVVIGPGLGNDAWAKFLLEFTLQWSLENETENAIPDALQKNKNIVVDADGLRLAKKLNYNLQHCIITPHPGEAAFLLDIAVAEIQQKRYFWAEKLSQTIAKVVILKGAGSICVTAKTGITVCPYGNAGMASAGMGDVLAGVVGGLLAQRLAPADAAESGMLLHSLAADRASHGEPVGLLASDLFPELKFLMNHSDNFASTEKDLC